MAQEQERNAKMNKKWNQMMGSKTYYYNSKGEAIEVSNTKTKLTKKSQNTI